MNEQGLRFDASVPVETIVVRDPAIEAIPDSRAGGGGGEGDAPAGARTRQLQDFEIRAPGREAPGHGGVVATPAAPANVLERTVVDVSFLAGMLVDKFRYHLPLYRQHSALGR